MDHQETPTASADPSHAPGPPVRQAVREDVLVELDDSRDDPMGEEAGYGYGV